MGSEENSYILKNVVVKLHLVKFFVVFMYIYITCLCDLNDFFSIFLKFPPEIEVCAISFILYLIFELSPMNYRKFSVLAASHLQ
jgi:hypothetical protein